MKKAETEQDLKHHQNSKAELKEAMTQANAVREKEATAYAKFKADREANLAALPKAINCCNWVWHGRVLHPNSTGKKASKLCRRKSKFARREQEETDLSFLSGSSSGIYTPQSGQITGNLKQLSYEEVLAFVQSGVVFLNAFLNTSPHFF